MSLHTHTHTPTHTHTHTHCTESMCLYMSQLLQEGHARNRAHTRMPYVAVRISSRCVWTRKQILAALRLAHTGHAQVLPASWSFRHRARVIYLLHAFIQACTSLYMQVHLQICMLRVIHTRTHTQKLTCMLVTYSHTYIHECIHA